MWERNYEYLKGIINSNEVLNLCWINERFDNEPQEVQEIRDIYSTVMSTICTARDKAWRSEAGRNYNIAITELENSCIRAVKWFYSK